MKKIIGLVGLTCSGKSLLASTAVELGMKLIETRKHVKNNFEFGMDKFLLDLRVISKRDSEIPAENFVIIDSLKNLHQSIRIEREMCTSLYLLGVHCGTRERKLRYAARKRVSVESLEERDNRELKNGLAEIFIQSNRILDSTGTTHSEFKGQTVSILLEIMTDVVNQKSCQTRWDKRDRILCFPEYLVNGR